MYRGEALEDFTGPDCRFVNFKRGDNVYVYYKLAGKSPEVWAGSVSKYLTYFFFPFSSPARIYSRKRKDCNSQHALGEPCANSAGKVGENDIFLFGLCIGLFSTVDLKKLCS